MWYWIKMSIKNTSQDGKMVIYRGRKGERKIHRMVLLVASSSLMIICWRIFFSTLPLNSSVNLEPFSFFLSSDSMTGIAKGNLVIYESPSYKLHTIIFWFPTKQAEILYWLQHIEDRIRTRERERKRGTNNYPGNRSVWDTRQVRAGCGSFMFSILIPFLNTVCLIQPATHALTMNITRLTKPLVIISSCEEDELESRARGRNG